MRKIKQVTIIGIRVGDRIGHASRVQNVLTAFGNCIIGRIGFPWPDKETGLIVVITEAAADDAKRLVDELQKIEEVKVSCMDV